MEDLDELLEVINRKREEDHAHILIPVTREAKEKTLKTNPEGFMLVTDKVRKPYGAVQNNEDMDDETLIKFKYARLRNQAKQQHQFWDLKLEDYVAAWEGKLDKIRDRRIRIYRLDLDTGWVKGNLIVGTRTEWMRATGRLKWMK